MSSAISQILGIETTSVIMFTTESSQPSLHQLAPANSNFFSQTHVSGGVIKHV